MNVKRFRAELILLSDILSACVTAFAGPVSLVGIAVPQLVKAALWYGKANRCDSRMLLGGAVFCLFSDPDCPYDVRAHGAFHQLGDSGI